MLSFQRSIRRMSRIAVFAVSSYWLVAPSCLNSDIAKRFRESYGPGVTAGLTSAITDPDNAEDGLRQTGAALFEGIGAILQPRSGSSIADAN